MSEFLTRHHWLLDIVKNRIKKEKIKDIPSELPSDFAESWQLVTNITGMIDDELCVLIADNFDLKVAEYENPDNDALSLVPERIARKYSVFPIKCTERMLTLATSNPLDQDMINILGFVSSHSINVVIASPNNLSTWITSSYSKFDFNTSGKSDDRHKVGYSINQSEFTPDVNDSVIKEMTVRMLHECYAQDASDIHLEPFAGGGVIRYRIDGLLRQITTLPKTVFEHLAQHIKSNGGMNIATRLVLQDGKSTITINDEAIGLRISAIPVSGGEKIVIRLLKNSIVGSLDTVGLQGQELERFKNIISNQNGIFLMTGPTGSGKSTTLYAAMRELNTYDRCLVAVEDPVEFEVDGIAQVSINPSKKVTFANSLRAFLRQDPDVILVGEIRDEETAEVAMRAALTGHFVLSTLHTN
jgi:type II secretory ATPase GspE/PulE/Tfp pilus assembly ATPase PilB-like protein